MCWRFVTGLFIHVSPATFQFVLKSKTLKIWKNMYVTCYSQVQLSSLPSIPPRPLRLTSLLHFAALTPSWPGCSFTLPGVLPIKPPPDLPTTFTFKTQLLIAPSSEPTAVFHYLSSPIIFWSLLHLIVPPSKPCLLLVVLLCSLSLQNISIHLNPWLDCLSFFNMFNNM